MFSLKIIDSDAFLEMPATAQALYFHLGMRADDDGFLNNAKSIQRMIGAKDSDLQTLFEKRFLLRFEGGVCVLKHWKINNLLRSDRHTPTAYVHELASLTTKKNGAYTEKTTDDSEMDTECQPDDNQMTTTCQPSDNQVTSDGSQDGYTDDPESEECSCEERSSQILTIQGCQPVDNQVTTKCQPNDNQVAPQYSIGKDRLDKLSIDNPSIHPTIDNLKANARKPSSDGRTDRIFFSDSFSLLPEEYKALCDAYGKKFVQDYAKRIADGISSGRMEPSAAPYARLRKMLQNAELNGELNNPDASPTPEELAEPRKCPKCGKRLNEKHQCLDCQIEYQYEGMGKWTLQDIPTPESRQKMADALSNLTKRLTQGEKS